MNEIQAQIRKQDETIALLRDLLDQLKKGQGNNSHASFNFNAGGLGLWGAVTACLMTLAACVPTMIILAIFTIDQGRRIDRAEDYLQSIFQQVPALKAEVDANIESKQEG